MLEVLKQLQVKPLAGRAQVEIFNRKQAVDCDFLGRLQLAVLSYKPIGQALRRVFGLGFSE